MRTLSLILKLATLTLLSTACSIKPAPNSAVTLSTTELPTTENEAKLFSRALEKIGIGKSPLKKSNRFNLQIFTAKNLNAGKEKESLPLVLKTYLLTSPEAFESLPFEAFLNNETIEHALEDTLIMQREAILMPGQFYEATVLLPTEAHYISFVALFRHPSPQRWRFTYNIRSSIKSGIQLGVHTCSLSSNSGLLINTLSAPAHLISMDKCADNGLPPLQQQLDQSR
mgnify:CR=1 FL=1